jgi:hypothetical protein
LTEKLGKLRAVLEANEGLLGKAVQMDEERGILSIDGHISELNSDHENVVEEITEMHKYVDIQKVIHHQ